MSAPHFLFRPPVIAHRGARAGAPENTLAAFKLAFSEGATWMETDIKLTHDGMPILMHDDSLDRTTNGQGAVADAYWTEAKNLDAGKWFSEDFAGEHIPTLSEALHYIISHNLHINLELKPCPGRTQATVMVTLIEAAKIWPQDYPPPLISSFNIDALIVASRLNPDWPLGLLLDSWTDEWPSLLKQTGATAIHFNEKCLTKDRVDKFVSMDLPVLAYTVNDPIRAQELLHWGVGAVFSDNPGEIIKVL